MTPRQLDKAYEPQLVEDRWYRYWVEKGFFHAAPDKPGAPYTIVIPPPNVTGSLHIGHALNNSIQDILIRWRRMQGRNALWVPGMDHAGIATQNVVERQLAADNLSRDALGREKFIERVWQWKAQSGGTIVQQLKRLGASCDWSRERFTMDEGLSTAVREVFVRLHEERLIYRGERLINWCPRCLTALSDIEVEHEDVAGKLFTITYPLADESGETLTVATTRPETMLGDTAVAVHPEDERFNRFIGRRVRVPLTNREIPVVGDPILVDREFGTGAVKITPAHDFNDFEAGERHRLPRVAIFDHQARLEGGKLAAAGVEASVIETLRDLPVSKARPKVEAMLAERGALVKAEAHKMAVGKCYRCKTVVEPYLSPQWFVKITPLAEPAIKAVEDGRIRIIPEGWVNNYLGWMRDIKDWCISRQIWWGHQVPAWYCLRCHKGRIQPGTREGAWVIPADAQPIVMRDAPRACPTCGGAEFIRDPDVLDTWFSSALWPFSTLGWPQQTVDLKTFYPTSTLVTGLDILFFWVARMIMMGLKFTGDVPFRDVYIHALVRDAEGQKMSKSKGNVIDPLQIMGRFGTDALRFTLASMASPGRDIKLAEERIEGYRNFANKIWNAARFMLMNLEGSSEAAPPAQRSFPDRWILHRLNRTIESVTQSLEQYRFDQAASALYHFMWHEYCDWYLELVKPALQDKGSSAGAQTRHTLVETFETLLRLLHPLMPFITEEIWQSVPHSGESIVTQPYPTTNPAWESGEMDQAFATLSQFVSVTRTGRSLLNYPPGKALTLYGASRQPGQTQWLNTLQGSLAHLSKGTVTLAAPDQWPGDRLLRLVVEELTVGLLVEGDVDLQKARERIAKQQAEGAKEVQRLSGKLGSADFTAKAPPEVIAEHQDRLRTMRAEQILLASSEEQLRAMIAGTS